MTNKPTNVDKWIQNRSDHQNKALENASKVFDDKDSFTVNTLEAIYGQESGFGKNKRTRGIIGAAGDFQIEKETAKEYGLSVARSNDQRFDVDDSSDAASRYIKDLDNHLRNGANLGGGLRPEKISDSEERKLFVIAAYNAGQRRIALAQKEAKADGKNSVIWDQVKNYLVKAGATEAKAKEIIEYVKKVLEYEKEFAEKSDLNKKLKDKDAQKKAEKKDGHWITLNDGRRVLIDKK